MAGDSTVRGTYGSIELYEKIIAYCRLCFHVPIFFSGRCRGHGVPTGDDAFYLEMQIDGYGVDMPAMPSGLPNVTASSRGVLVVNGQVVEQEFTASLGSSESYCQQAGIRCAQKKSISGTYQNGNLDVTVKNEITRTYDGQAVGGIGDPVVPGSTVRLSVDHFVGNMDDPGIQRFRGTLTHTFIGEGVECAKWRDGEGGICDLDRYFEKAPVVTKYDWTGFVRAPGDGVTVISKTNGEVEKRRAGETEFTPLAAGDIIAVGDTVGTGYNSSAWINTGFGSIIVQPLTQLRLDAFEMNKLRRSGRALLSAGNVGAIISQPATIRSDFSVSTPSGANAAIRGSEMLVGYDEQTRVTTVFVYEDKAYVTGNADQSEREVSEGNKVTVDENGSVSSPTGLAAEDLADRPAAASDGGGIDWRWVGALLALLAVVMIVLAIRRRTARGG